MVILGDMHEFAVEVLVEKALHGWPGGAPEQLSGRVRIWAQGHTIGDLDDWGCCLGNVLDELQQGVAELEERWHPELLPMSAEQRFDHLDRVFFAAHRHRSLSDGLDDAGSDRLDAECEVGRRRYAPCMYWLLHASEAFDGWKPFLLRPPGELVQLLWLEAASPEVHEACIRISTFTRVIAEFARWFAAEDAEWQRRRADGPRA